MMECTYVHVQSDLINVSVRKNMHLFMTVTSKLFINQFFGDIVYNRAYAPIYVLNNNDR